MTILNNEPRAAVLSSVSSPVKIHELGDGSAESHFATPSDGRQWRGETHQSLHQRTKLDPGTRSWSENNAKRLNRRRVRCRAAAALLELYGGAGEAEPAVTDRLTGPQD